MTVRRAQTLIKLKDVLERVPLSRSQVYKMITAGTFPSQVQISGRAVAWKSDEIDAWIATCECRVPQTLLQRQQTLSMRNALAQLR
jgi:prophage regulatory protein